MNIKRQLQYLNYAIATIVTMLSISSCQQLTVSQSNSSTNESQESRPESAKKASEQLLSALRDNKFEEVTQLTCRQKTDLTRSTPIGIQEWEVQEVREQTVQTTDDNAKYFVVLTGIKSEESSQLWSIKAWKSEEFFAYSRRSTERFNELQSKFNEISRRVELPTEPLEELPSRKDIALTPYCVETVVHPDNFQVKP